MLMRQRPKHPAETQELLPMCQIAVSGTLSVAENEPPHRWDCRKEIKMADTALATVTTDIDAARAIETVVEAL
jgi:hypothetical protein